MLIIVNNDTERESALRAVNVIEHLQREARSMAGTGGHRFWATTRQPNERYL